MRTPMLLGLPLLASIHMEYGLVENKTINVVRVVKLIQPKESDPLNTGGSISVIIRAEEDLHFKKAKNVPPQPSTVATEQPKKQ